MSLISARTPLRCRYARAAAARMTACQPFLRTLQSSAPAVVRGAFFLPDRSTHLIRDGALLLCKFAPLERTHSQYSLSVKASQFISPFHLRRTYLCSGSPARTENSALPRGTVHRLRMLSSNTSRCGSPYTLLIARVCPCQNYPERKVNKCRYSVSLFEREKCPPFHKSCIID